MELWPLNFLQYNLVRIDIWKKYAKGIGVSLDKLNIVIRWCANPYLSPRGVKSLDEFESPCLVHKGLIHNAHKVPR